MRPVWLLFIRSGKSNVKRLALTATAVGLGMFMFLIFMTGVTALQAQTQHNSWRFDLFTGEANQTPIEGIAPLKAKVLTNGNLSKWQNTDITRVALYATGSNSPELKGLKTPEPGEYYVSQGLDAIMRAHPNEQIGMRFGTKQIGVIPQDLSKSPDSLEVILGMNAAEAQTGHVVDVYRFSNETEAVSRFSGAIGMILVFGASILLFPIMTFISIATQLGSAQREKRYAALRLVGATRQQVTAIMALESISAALVGIVVGSLLYLITLPLMSEYRFGGMRFWPSDLAVQPIHYLLAVGLVLAFCLIANWWGMRHVHVSPLGVSRSGKLDKRPRMWRLILLVPGLLVFIWFSLPSGMKWLGENAADSSLPLFVLMFGVLSIMFGLVLAGPWLTSSLSRLVMFRTKNPVVLLASKRIALQSGRIFRSVSGVVLALFAGSFYLTSVSGIEKLNAGAVESNGYSMLKDATAYISSDSLPSDFVQKLRKLSYVASADAITQTAQGQLFTCDQLASYTRLTCPSNKTSDELAVVNFNAPAVKSATLISQTSEPLATNYIVTLKTNDDLDSLRTFIAKNTDNTADSWVVSGTYAQLPIINPVIPELANLAYIGMTVTLLVAIASLIVSTIGGLLERRRSFFTLRLGGMTITQMKQTIMIESLVPLIGVSVLACGLGVWVGWVFITALSDSTKPALTPLYFAIVIASLLLAVIAIRTVVPMIEKITRPEENQTE